MCSDKYHSRLKNIVWSLTLCIAVIHTHSASIYPNNDLPSNPIFEPICSEQQERFIESDGKESSLILELNRPISLSLNTTETFCRRILTTPESYGFIVRLIRPKIRKNFQRYEVPSGKETIIINNGSEINNEQKMKTENTTTLAIRSCPLTIFSSLDPFRASWLVDPCQLEDSSFELEDPVRLFQGRLRILWEHRNYTLDSKLMVTVLGKGTACQMQNKHSCLKIGLEPLLCISKALACDGIRHCPYSNEYDSDEDYTMCWKRKKIDINKESDVWEHWAIEIFRNLFAFDVPTMATTLLPENNFQSSSTMKSILKAVDGNSTTLTKINSTHSVVENKLNTTIGGSHKRNSTRSGLNSDLSKYGPWGYLMLGMLLCGGALLICGLWASASQTGQNENDSSMQQGSAVHGNSSIDQQSSLPPNYEELDPPPSYSVLFPNQKAMSIPTLAEHINIQPVSIVVPSDTFVLPEQLTIVTSSLEISEPNSSSINIQQINPSI